jgi:glycosyltransferase involved in cell wall biosynthesis
MKTLAVLLPTYNAASYLKDSINSILNQTFEDFHLHIYDDFSDDDTEDIVTNYDDKRIFYQKSKENLGIAKTLNKGFDDLLPNYKYIARMDADDWSYPQRLELQLKMFEEDTELIMCGTQGYWLTDLDRIPLVNWKYPVEYNALKLNLLFSGSFGHSSVMFDSEFLLKNKIRYNDSIETCEDWELWSRILMLGKAMNSSEFLMKYRILPFSNHRNPNTRELHLKERSEIIVKQWFNFGFVVNRNDIYSFYYSKQKLEGNEFKRVLSLFIKLFNDINYTEISKISKESQIYFRYRFVRNILNFWRNSGISRFSPEIWLLIISKVKFVNKFTLLRNILR